MLAIARALVCNPSVLLMDEPTEGLAPVIIEQLVEAMHTLRSQEGLTIVLVEQHTGIALEFSERTVVMNRGRIVYDGPSATPGRRRVAAELAGGGWRGSRSSLRPSTSRRFTSLRSGRTVGSWGSNCGVPRSTIVLSVLLWCSPFPFVLSVATRSVAKSKDASLRWTFHSLSCVLNRSCHRT